MPEVYLLRGYPQEVIATAFAKTSRSPSRFIDMANELDADKSRQFHERWVVGYGHSSVAEHAVLHIAVEGASRLAVEVLESGRLASYTEQSSRYQKMRMENVYWSDKWMKEFQIAYRETMKWLFDLYPLLEDTMKKHGVPPRREFDVARFALPLSIHSNVGITINARALRRTICKMLAHPFEEIRDLARQIESAAKDEVPTLLRHIKPCHLMMQANDMGREYSPAVPYSDHEAGVPLEVRCVKFDVDEEEIRKTLAFAISEEGFHRERITSETLEEFLGSIDQHDQYHRALEMGRIVFEVTSDYGSYYDIKRHRMATIIPQRKVGGCGYVIPAVEVLQRYGVLETYMQVMDSVRRVYEQFQGSLEAQYLLPHAFRKRYLIQVNPRELIELVRVRGVNPEGHTSYRAIACQMLELVQEKCPDIFGWMSKWLPDDCSAAKLQAEYGLKV